MSKVNFGDLLGQRPEIFERLLANSIKNALIEANQFRASLLAPLVDVVHDVSFNLVANVEQRYPVLGDFWRVFLAAEDIQIKLDHGQFDTKKQGHSWTAPIGQGYKFITLKSATTQTITMSLGFGRLDDSSSVITVNDITTDLQKIAGLGNNLEIKYVSGTVVKVGAGTTDLTLYSCPASHKALLLHANTHFTMDGSATYNKSGMFMASGGSNWIHAVQGVSGFNPGTNNFGFTQSFAPIQELEIVATDAFTIRANVVGGNMNVAGALIVAEYDA